MDGTLSAIVICVDYADQLAKGLAKWRDGVDRLLVVSAPRDEATRELCKAEGVQVCLTDVFWEGGAKFNKGAAMVAAYRKLQPKDWALFFDADIEPPEGWRYALEGVVPGTLYGAKRRQAGGELILERDLAGYFQLAHVSDPNMRHDPIVDVHWFHAGNYDTTFMQRWPESKQRYLPFEVVHHGEMGKNWCGVGNDKAVELLRAERRRRRGGWRHETI